MEGDGKDDPWRGDLNGSARRGRYQNSWMRVGR